MEKKRRTEITVETNQVLVIRRRPSEDRVWCAACAAPSTMLGPEEAAAAAGLSRQAIYQGGESPPVPLHRNGRLGALDLPQLISQINQKRRSVMKRKIGSIVFAICLVSLLVLGLISRRSLGGGGADLVPKVQGQASEVDDPFERDRSRPCSLGTLKGRYGFTFTGTLVSPPLPPAVAGPFAAVGLVTFNGDGNASFFDTVSRNGTILTTSATGTYTVNEDCTGSSTFIDDSGRSTNDYFVIVDHGKEIRSMLTGPGVVLTGSFMRQ